MYSCNAFSCTEGCMPGERWTGSWTHTYPRYVRPGDTCLCGERKVIAFCDPYNPKGAIITERNTNTNQELDKDTP
jgi:hypothetical protein